MKNRGKSFEQVIREAFLKVPDVSIDRIPDQTMRYRGAKNICDFIVYKKPYEYYIECKSVHGASLPFTNVSETQWEGLLEKSKIEGVFAGVICWWVDKDVTKFLPIQMLQNFYELGMKSINWEDPDPRIITVQGKKKRVFFDYDMDGFFHSIEKGQRRQV